MKIKDGFIVRQVAGSYIAMPIGERAEEINGVIELTQGGAFLWEKLSEDTTTDALVAELLSKFDVDDETARRDTIAFVDNLRANNLLEE